MKSRALSAVCWLAGGTEPAFLAVVDRQEHKIAHFKVLVLDLAANGLDSTRTFVSEHCWKFAYWNLALLKYEVLTTDCVNDGSRGGCHGARRLLTV